MRIDWRKVVLVTAATLVAAVPVYADMMPQTCGVVADRASTSVCRPADSRLPLDLGLVGLESGPAGLFCGIRAGGVQASDPQPVSILVDRQDSFSLCLYALVGLGLCKSAPWVKRLSLGVIPAWYHDGGPFQVGHSHAISPDCLTVAPGHCFIQPDNATHHPLPRYRREMTISLLRKSQCTPSSLAPRSPPTLA